MNDDDEGERIFNAVVWGLILFMATIFLAGFSAGLWVAKPH